MIDDLKIKQLSDSPVIFNMVSSKWKRFVRIGILSATILVLWHLLISAGIVISLAFIMSALWYRFECSKIEKIKDRCEINELISSYALNEVIIQAKMRLKFHFKDRKSNYQYMKRYIQHTWLRQKYSDTVQKMYADGVLERNQILIKSEISLFYDLYKELQEKGISFSEVYRCENKHKQIIAVITDTADMNLYLLAIDNSENNRSRRQYFTSNEILDELNVISNSFE